MCYRLVNTGLLLAGLVSSLASTADVLDRELGHQLFEKLWVSSPASTRSSDGLGPLFNARSCESCHFNAGRGSTYADRGQPSAARVIKLSAFPSHEEQIAMQAGALKSPPDPWLGMQIQTRATQGLAVEAQFEISEHSIIVDGYPLPSLDLKPGKLRWDQSPLYSIRLAPPLYGLGLLSRIPEQDLLARADPDDLDKDGISGRVNWVNVDGELRPGRFGWKASHASLLSQTAEAFHVDLGLSTTRHPAPFGDCQPTQIKCLAMPHGSSPNPSDPEVSDSLLDLVVTYLEALNPPYHTEPDVLFVDLGCEACHTARHTISTASGTETIHPYTDLLLHDMGEGLSDGLAEYQANGNEWRTPPLWGISRNYFDNGQTGYLHDGRAKSLYEAILWHGGEASAARDRFLALNSDSQKSLIQFLEQL